MSTTAAVASGRRSGWTALVVTTLARVVLTGLASLVLWAVLPTVTGAHPTVVMTGSMLPRLVPGDVVFSREVAPDSLQLGQVLLFTDPDRPGHLRMHRWVDVGADGRLVTRGDANPQRDSTPVERSAVVGVASLRVPVVARPVVWAAEGRRLPLLATGLGLLLVAVAACWFRAAPDPSAADGDGDTGSDTGTGGGDGTGDGTGTGDAVDVASAGPSPTRRRLMRAGTALAAVTLLGLGTATAAEAAPARFGATTTDPASSFTSATFFSCGGAARASGARFSWPLGEPSAAGGAQDVTANDVDGAYTGGVTYGVPGPCRTDGSTGVTLNGSSGTVASTLTADAIAELSTQLWIRAVPGSRGGTLVSFTDNGFLGLFPSSSYAVGMGATGGLTFAFAQGGTRYVVAAPTDLRDNGWHQVTAVAGTSGMALYVDGVVVASNQGVRVSTTGVTGTPRIGYGVASSLGTGSANWFQGSVAFASLWKLSLQPATVLASYRAAV